MATITEILDRRLANLAARAAAAANPPAQPPPPPLTLYHESLMLAAVGLPLSDASRELLRAAAGPHGSIHWRDAYWYAQPEINVIRIALG